jgi:hypothetical protein
MQNMTPAQIDTQLAEIYGRWLDAIAAKAGAEKAAKEYRSYGTRYETNAIRYDAQAAQAQAVIEKLDAEMAPFEREFTRRGGWTRFFMVMNNGGHLHSSRSCSTCRWTTAFAWMPEYSGADEAEIVDLAGEDACTVCFPTAPVDRQSRLPFRVVERAEREALAAEKAAKRNAAEAAKITVGRKVYKTQRGAENEAGFEIESAISSRYMDARDAEHREYLDRLTEERIAAAREIAEAIAESVEGYDVEGFLNKKFDAKVKQYRKAGWNIPADAKL